jgi:hypothetical protein
LGCSVSVKSGQKLFATFVERATKYDMIDGGLGGLTIPETNQKPELFSSSKIVYFAALKGKGRNCYFFGEIWKIHESMEKYWKEIAGAPKIFLAFHRIGHEEI